MAGRIAYLGNIATQGLVLNLDAAIKGSYPGTGTTWTDVSNNGNNGTLTNGPTFSSADYGSIVFDGTDDYVTTSYTNSPVPFTFVNWVKPSAVNSTRVMFYGNSNNYFTSFNNNAFTFGRTGIAHDVTSTVTFNTSSWYHLGATINSNANVVLYVNGTPQNTGTSTILTPNTNIKISDTLFPFSGSIATAQIYNQALTQFQVWNNFNSYKSRYGIPDIVTDGLVLNLDAGNPYSYLSGSSGTTWVNTVAVSSSISGTLVNGTRYSNGAMVFDGTNDYVSIPAHPTSSGLTLSFWAYIPSTLGTLPTLIGDGSQSNTVGYIWIYRSDVNQVTWQFATSTVRGLINDTTIFSGSLNAWANYVFVADYTNYPTGSLTTYKNGVLSTTTTFPNVQIPLSRTRFIGSYDGGGLFPLSGSISSYVEYNRALSQAEITQNFNALRGRYGI
jgi:hypothetical protein